VSAQDLIAKWEDALEESLRKVAILARQEELSEEDLENAAGVRLRSGVLAAAQDTSCAAGCSQTF
jgi:hypothetical protein